ncbi:glycogen synthase GlgA [Inhella sp.]|uniref:glycogen synthase GlgA n=1 Tax=Inhella sp. TaxID=1921806 RepID=UPI0035B3A2B1
MRVLQLSAELFPFIKTGGLADVAAALPVALRDAGAEPRLLLPGHPALMHALEGAEALAPDTAAGPLLRGQLPGFNGIPVYLLAHESFERDGPLYGHADDAARFARLGAAAVRLCEGWDPGWAPQLLHAHDWHAGAACAQLAWSRAQLRSGTRSLFTVHNLAYQGLFPASEFPLLGLPAGWFGLEGVEFFGQLSFMKAGLQFADQLSTVSPGYAKEIQTAEQGCGLDGLLRRRADALHGILNGVDAAVWNPATDPALPTRYSAGQWAAKAQCKDALRREFGLSTSEGPLFAVVSRLTEQKGLPLVLDALPELLDQGGQLVVLGQGEEAPRMAFAAQTYTGQVALAQAFDEALAHRIYAGADVVLMPSRFEPCGLSQLYGLKYGTLPLVRRVGGLADTVVDCTLEDLEADRATGFVFERFETADYRRALERAFTLWRKPTLWRQVQRRAMAQDFGWEAAAQRYLALYRNLFQ